MELAVLLELGGMIAEHVVRAVVLDDALEAAGEVVGADGGDPARGFREGAQRAELASQLVAQRRGDLSDIDRSTAGMPVICIWSSFTEAGPRGSTE